MYIIALIQVVKLFINPQTPLMITYFIFLALIIFTILLKTESLLYVTEVIVLLHIPIILFITISVLIILPLPLALAITNSRDALQGSHPSRDFSTDIFTPFINGGYWRFSRLTNLYWSNIRAGAVEGTVYLTVTSLVMPVIALFKRNKIHRDVIFWITAGTIFALFSLGPRLLVAGNTIEKIILPYAVLEFLIPQIRLSGVPVRMMVMTIFASAIVTTMVLSKLNLKEQKGKIIMALVSLVLILELWPATLPVTPAVHAKYFKALRNLPSTGGVLDN